MARMKTFRTYFLIFISLYIVINLLTYGAMRNTYHNMELCEINFISPDMEILEAKSSYSSGYIVGKITNDTGSIINLKYLKFEFYNENGTYLGTRYKELKYFNVDETQEFRLEYQLEKASSVRISLVELIEERELTLLEQESTLWLSAIGIIVIYFLLP